VNFQTKEIETAVFMMEGKLPKKQDIKTLEQLRAIFPWKSKAKFIISIPKFWFSLAEDTIAKKKKMGVMFRIEQIFITERGGFGINKKDFTQSLFTMFNNDDEDDNTNQYDSEQTGKSTKKITNVTKEAPKKNNNDSDDSESEKEEKPNENSDDSDSDSSEDDKPKPKSKK